MANFLTIRGFHHAIDLFDAAVAVRIIIIQETRP
jgi:hypothetical protein